MDFFSPTPVTPVRGVYVRQMSAREAIDYDKKLTKGDDSKAAMNNLAELLAACVCDADGKLILTREKADEAIDRLPHEVCADVANAAMKMNGMGEVALQKKHSKNATSKDSPTDLQHSSNGQTPKPSSKKSAHRS